jgi:hypothetical protein
MTIYKKCETSLPEYSGAQIYQVIALLIYCVISMSFYFYCNALFESRKGQISNDYYKIILNNTVITLEDLLQKFPLNQSKDIIINISKSDIKTCYKEQCINSNLFGFASTIDKYLPNFINYKIEINRQLLHCNNKILNYDFEKISPISKYNQIAIGIGIDSEYLNIIRDQITKSFLITMIFWTLLLILFIWSIRSENKGVQKFYSYNYKNFYDSELKMAKEDYEHKLQYKEDLLMKRIWDLEYEKEKDIEINHLFSEEANKLAMITHKTESHNYDYPLNDKTLPCSMILYYPNIRGENIRIKNLIEIFSEKFVKSEENISFFITSDQQNVNFASKASLYQIIYSLLTYINFILKEQSLAIKYRVKLDITKEQEGCCLVFEYDGLLIQNEEELFKFSNKFFKKHVNPFLLSVEQIFYVLKADNYNCTISCNNTNFVKINRKVEDRAFGNKQDNIIKLPKKTNKTMGKSDEKIFVTNNVIDHE